MRLCFIGAGSSIFAKNLLTDIFQIEGLGSINLRLHDIDGERLKTTERIASHLATKLKVNLHLEASEDRRAMLKDADFVITMMQVGGYKPCTVRDFEIPKKFGLRQTIADTLGIGGIMRGLRTIPVVLDICQDIIDLCPQAYLLNYVNPMPMLCEAIGMRFPSIKTVGLCHSIQYTLRELAEDLGIPHNQIHYQCAGINHMAFFLKLEHKGQTLYPRLHQLAREGKFPPTNRVRYDILQRLGYFVTESSEHFSEYVPWFIKASHPELIEEYKIPLDEYIRRCEKQSADWKQMKEELEAGRGDYDTQASVEYADQIIAAIMHNKPALIYGNVPNKERLISNLPDYCCVEVPCLVDSNGVQPVSIGRLPSHLAALMQTNINVHHLTVEASLTSKRERIYQAAMLDPHTAAELSLDQIWQLVDELLIAHKDWLPRFH